MFIFIQNVHLNYENIYWLLNNENPERDYVRAKARKSIFTLLHRHVTHTY